MLINRTGITQVRLAELGQHGTLGREEGARSGLGGGTCWACGPPSMERGWCQDLPLWLGLTLIPGSPSPIQPAWICATDLGGTDPSSLICATAALPKERGIDCLCPRLQHSAGYGVVQLYGVVSLFHYRVRNALLFRLLGNHSNYSGNPQGCDTHREMQHQFASNTYISKIHGGVTLIWTS